MDAKTRAERIMRKFEVKTDWHMACGGQPMHMRYIRAFRQAAVEWVASQIEEAEREARNEVLDSTVNEQITKAFMEGFIAAREKAAEIAESRPTGSSDDGMVVQSDIAASIRSMTPDLKDIAAEREGGRPGNE